MKITPLIRKLLGYDGMQKRVDSTITQMQVESNKTSRQIVEVNTKIIKTQTYFFGKALGVIK